MQKNYYSVVVLYGPKIRFLLLSLGRKLQYYT
jgi:hypothetical protein